MGGDAPMLIRHLAQRATGEVRIASATVSWEDRDFPDQVLSFEIQDEGCETWGGEADTKLRSEPSADAFLTACFPLAAVHGESRVRIEGRPCPMLVEGLRTVHAWWSSWGGMPTAAPQIETMSGGPRSGASRRVNTDASGGRRGACFLSGGVDGLHMLMRNHRLYDPEDPAYIRTALFIHGFDIGKRACNPEDEHYRMALGRLRSLAVEAGIRIIPCRTNLRHLPTLPGFWTHRQNGSALAAVGHAAIRGPAFLFIGSTYHLAELVPLGSHPAVDVQFSSQRISFVHEGARFSRVDKVRELATWPGALAALRVCPANFGGAANCGACEKCLETRLELLAAGVDETPAFGPSATPIELWQATEAVPSFDRALRYEALLAPLQARGFAALCRVLEEKIAAYRQQVREGARWPEN